MLFAEISDARCLRPSADGGGVYGLSDVSGADRPRAEHHGDRRVVEARAHRRSGVRKRERQRKRNCARVAALGSGLGFSAARFLRLYYRRI